MIVVKKLGLYKGQHMMEGDLNVDDMVAFEFNHVGINTDGAEDFKELENFFKNAFNLSITEGPISDYAGSNIEIMKKRSKGSKGHIAMGTRDCEKAINDLLSRGFEVDMSSAKYLPDGTIRMVYLKNEIGGFAVHLTKID